MLIKHDTDFCFTSQDPWLRWWPWPRDSSKPSWKADGTAPGTAAQRRDPGSWQAVFRIQRAHRSTWQGQRVRSAKSNASYVDVAPTAFQGCCSVLIPVPVARRGNTFGRTNIAFSAKMSYSQSDASLKRYHSSHLVALCCLTSNWQNCFSETERASFVLIQTLGRPQPNFCTESVRSYCGTETIGDSHCPSAAPLHQLNS